MQVNSQNRNKIVKKILTYSILITFAFLCVFPFYILFVNATRSTIDIQNVLSFFPSKYFFKNFVALSNNILDLSVYRALFNSFFIAIVSMLLNVYFSALTAYAFHTYSFKGKKVLFNIVLIVIMIPSQLGLIGFYQFMLQLDWQDSYLPLILPSISSSANVFFMKQFYDTLKVKEIVEAARIDGKSEFYIFNVIILPLSISSLATIGIGAFIGSWNNYLMPFLLLSSPEKSTMPMLVQILKTNLYTTDLGAIYCGLLLTVIPLVIIYLFFSKFIIGGVTQGGIKE